MTTCEECGFTLESHERSSLPAELRHTARAVRAALGAALDEAGGLDRLRQRPAPESWSALEVAGHLRDVLLTQRDRVFHALVVDEATFPPMHRDERALLGRYNAEDPTTTATELVLAADRFAWLLESLDDAGWARHCRYNYPEPTDVDLLFVARHTLHEEVHHLLDVNRALAAATG